METAVEFTPGATVADEATSSTSTALMLGSNALSVSNPAHESELWTEATLREKYQQEIAKCRKLETSVVQLKRKLDNAAKEKDVAVAEYSRAVTLRSKLENICRQLQKQNKTIEEESVSHSQEDENQRTTLSEKFHATIEDITKRMNEHDKDKELLTKENETLKVRVENLKEQRELREQHYAQQLKIKEMHLHLCATRLKHQAEVLQQSMMRNDKYQQKIREQYEMVGTLREQLSDYGSKFQQCVGTLDNSNKIFSTFHADLDKMIERVTSQQKQNFRLKKAKARSVATLEELKAERDSYAKKVQQLEHQREKLLKLHAALVKETESNAAGGVSKAAIKS